VERACEVDHTYNTKEWGKRQARIQTQVLILK